METIITQKPANHQAIGTQILVLDDDEALRNLIIRTLTKSGITSAGAAKGSEAIEMATANPSLLLLLDQKLPDMTGADVINALAQQPKKVSFIVMTGQGDERLAVEMMKLGAEDYLVKDTDFLTKLPGVIDRVFRNLETAKKLEKSESEKAKLQYQLVQAQKMESVGRLAGGVAHDFNNMLGAILGYSELALKKIDPADPVHDYLDQIYKAAERSADLTRQLLAFARKQAITPKIIDLNETITGMLRMLQRLIGENIQLIVIPGKTPIKVNIDPSQVDQLLANLCVNARDAISNNGKITIETGLFKADTDFCQTHSDAVINSEYAILSISDNGCGMDQETISHLFEPFFTTKELGRGTGLGLATIYGIMKQNEGFIEVISAPDSGTTFRLFLPHCANAVEKADEDNCGLPVEKGDETILLVEDEPFVLQMTSTMLKHLGYQVVSATSPRQALELVKSSCPQISLLITDIVMPEMNGKELAEMIQQLCPGLMALYISGYTADIIAQHGIIEEGTHFLQKPFSLKTLAKKVREVLNIKGGNKALR
jgi:signal transduction histidine kinase